MEEIGSSTLLDHSEDLGSWQHLSETQPRSSTNEGQPEQSDNQATQSNGQNQLQNLSSCSLEQSSNNSNDNETPTSPNHYNMPVSANEMPELKSRHDLPIPITVVKSKKAAPFKMVEGNDGSLCLVAQFDSGMYCKIL